MKKTIGIMIFALGMVGVLTGMPVQAQTNDFLQGLKAFKGIVERAQKDQNPTPTENTGAVASGGQRGYPTNAVEYCEVIKNSPLVKEYVSALAKAVGKNALKINDDVDSFAYMRLDNQDGLLQQWVLRSKSPTGESGKTATTNFGRNVVEWASQCAAENNSNDLFLFFVEGLSNPDKLKQLREKARIAYAAVNSTSQKTRLDENGKPVVQVVNNKRLDFDLGYENSRYNVDTYTMWVTLSAFALPNGLAALESTGKNNAKQLSDMVDQTLIAHEQRNGKALAEQKEKDKIEVQRVAAENKEKAEAAAAKNSPNKLLFDAYEAFQIVQACFDARKGYAAVYVNDVELTDAKEKMRKIESALKPKLTGMTSDQLWAKAAAENDRVFKGFGSAKFENANGMCSIFKNSLRSTAEKVLINEVPKRTF